MNKLWSYRPREPSLPLNTHTEKRKHAPHTHTHTEYLIDGLKKDSDADNEESLGKESGRTSGGKDEEEH
jgi:hypothetical protein